MENRSKPTITFHCRNGIEADVTLRAIRAHKRVIMDRGDDPRNYAPAKAGCAGFGWDAMERLALDLGTGTTSYMSVRMARAMREALESYRDATAGRDDRVTILDITYRLNVALEGSE